MCVGAVGAEAEGSREWLRGGKFNGVLFCFLLFSLFLSGKYSQCLSESSLHTPPSQQRQLQKGGGYPVERHVGMVLTRVLLITLATWSVCMLFLHNLHAQPS